MRQERMIEYLYMVSQIISSSSLAERFHISERTLVNDIKFINETGSANGFRVARIRGKGYQFKILDAKLFSVYQQKVMSSNLSDNDNPKRRVKNLQLTLLFHDAYITLQQIADAMQISISTVKGDLKHTEPFFAKYDLVLHRKAHYGIKLIGSEGQKRQAIIKLLKKNMESPLITPQYARFKTQFRESALRLFLKNILNDYQLKMSDIIFENIVQHIELFCFRILQQNNITDEELVEDTHQNDVYHSLANDIADYLVNEYQIVLPQAGKNYLREQLKGKITASQDKNVNQVLFTSIEQVLQKIDEDYRTVFSHDEALANALLLHVAPLLQRLYNGHQLENPVIEDIYTRYANVFNLALSFINELNENLDVQISKDEIGYVAIYFAASLEKQASRVMEDYQRIAVVCATGGGASYLLKVKLERIFTNAVVETFSVNEIAKIDDQYDLMISTVPLDEFATKVPIIFTKNMMTEKEIRKIEKDLILLRESKASSIDLNQTLLNLFHEEWFHIETSKKSYLEIIEYEGKHLENIGWACEGYTASVLQRERMIDTIYRQGIAGPHPMESMAKHEVINVVLLKPTILYQEKLVRLIFIINISKGHLYLHKEISRLMIKMMEDLALDKQLKKIKDYQDFIDYIKSLLKEG